MPIWKLSPVPASAADNAWAFTRWFGPALVRAENPGVARKMAAEAFRRSKPGALRADPMELESPWLNDGLVGCQRVAISTYRPDGPPQILQPQTKEYKRADAKV